MKKIYILSKMIERYEKALKYCMLHYSGLVKALDCKRTNILKHRLLLLQMLMSLSMEK